MSQLSHQEYDRLERAVTRGERIIIYRRGTEYVLVPLALRMRDGREMIEARNPTTGDDMSVFLDELDSIEVVAR
jgi:antitoxin (DNA-binding transcriptional repressor) of toxin-antitoxin stability system